MTYVITAACVGTKDNSCVEVCPVDCIHPTMDDPEYAVTDHLHIDPSECIDCNACTQACPVDAIYSDIELPAEHAAYLEINARYFERS